MNVYHEHARSNHNATPTGIQVHLHPKTKHQNREKENQSCIKFKGDRIILNDRFQLSRVSESVFNNRAAGHQNVLLGPCSRLGLNREMYPSIAKNPTTLLGKFDNCTLGLQEKKVLGVGDWKGGVRFLRAISDFATDSTDKNLVDFDVSKPISSRITLMAR